MHKVILGTLVLATVSVANSALADTWIASPISADKSDRYRNQEYGFTVSFPADSVVCVAASWTHPHGFYSPKDVDKSCDGNEAPAVSVFGIYADYNVTGRVTPSEAVAEWCHSDRPSRRLTSEQLAALSVSGRATAVCTEDKGKDEVLVTLAVQSDHKFEADRGSRPVQAPAVNYYLTLHSKASTLKDDLRSFKTFVASLRLERLH